jgi:hypothetical protein
MKQKGRIRMKLEFTHNECYLILAYLSEHGEWDKGDDSLENAVWVKITDYYPALKEYYDNL